MGQRLISLKGQAQSWRGRTRLSVNDRGQRKFLKLENCYVSQDGSEIRQFPGYGTFIDLTEINNATGFNRYVPDAIRPVLDFTSPLDPYLYPQTYSTSSSQTLWSRAKPASLFAFEQIGNEVFIIGESRFREDPIYDSSRSQLTVDNIGVDGSSRYVLVMSANVSSNTATDSGAGLNGLEIGHIVYPEGMTTADAADQALLDSRLNGKLHEVVGISGADVTLSTTIGGTFSTSPITITAGEIHRVRPNRSDTYATDGTNDPYHATYNNRPDDPDALTVWRVTQGIDMLDVTTQNNYPCYPAWVANRQRDFGDENDSGMCEGIILHNNGLIDVRGASRREQRKLPYRPNVEPALDRLILAVPQYGCMFQIPAKVPVDASDWQSGGTSDVGIVHPNNNIYDRPRSLGIPKPRLVESVSTPHQTIPSTSGDFDISITARNGSPDFGLVEGDYKFAISFEDAGTGEEGLASEPITVTLPASSAGYAYTITINYIHPGYFMPETLALKMNVYIAPPGLEAMAFYGSFELAEAQTTFMTPDISGVYGFGPACTPGERMALVRRFDLPMRNDTGDIESVLDPTRLAPQSATMPRGADACKYIRGVLFAGGALGNAGPQGQLWRAKASSSYTDGGALYDSDELRIRAHGLSDAAVPPVSGSIDGSTSEGTLGIAGRAMPDAYQGIDVITQDLFPGADSIKTTDKIDNRRVLNLTAFITFAGGDRYWHDEIVRLRRSAFDRGRIAGSSPLSTTIDKESQDVFYVMPRGQVQIGDPGEPGRSSRAFIKLIDPNEGDDITAIGHLAGSAIICTRKETHSYSWYRNPAGETPNLMSNEFGCIGSNTMVEFDGGLAWLSERGPVALGQGIQHIGAEIAEDFYGQDRIYMRDSTGLMRHAWSHHDAERGLVMWGLLRRDSTVQVSYEGQTYTTVTSPLSDKILSRFPCDEVLIWSYRANAFSTWRPPAGLEVIWMRTLRDASGLTRTCFLAADQRIYAFDDTWSDANGVFNNGTGGLSATTFSPAASGSGTTLTLADGANSFQDGDNHAVGRNLSLFLRAGMLVEFLDTSGRIVAETAISSVTTTSESGTTVIELAASCTWLATYKVRIGARQRMKILTNYIGAENMDTMRVDAVQMRYTLEGAGSANARVKLFKSEHGTGTGEESFVVPMTEDGYWDELGWQKAGTTIPDEIQQLGRRKTFRNGSASAPEIACQVEITGEAQVRIQDISFEVG